MVTPEWEQVKKNQNVYLVKSKNNLQWIRLVQMTWSKCSPILKVYHVRCHLLLFHISIEYGKMLPDVTRYK
jgi:hypothetical protein